MPRKNDRSRKPRLKKAIPGQQARSLVPKKGRPKSGATIEHMVPPSGRCGRKLIYATRELALKALRQVQSQRREEGRAYAENRAYLCDRGPHYHLTSLETYTPRETR